MFCKRQGDIEKKREFRGCSFSGREKHTHKTKNTLSGKAKCDSCFSHNAESNFKILFQVCLISASFKSNHKEFLFAW